MLLSIVTINYKTPEQTLDCVRSVVKQFENELKAGVVELIVVDNGSNDQSYKVMEKRVSKEKLPGVTIIENKENVGFGRGCNSGAEHAKGKFFLFLNSDTIIGDKNFIKMTEFLEGNPHAGIMGGRMKNVDGSSQFSTWKFYTLWNLFLILLGGERFGLVKDSVSNIAKVDWVTGACLMIKKEVFEKIGGFDKKIFMYMEDMELCFSAKKNGFDTYFFPFIEVMHKAQGSSNRSFAIVNIYKGIHYFYRKHFPVWQSTIADFLLKTKSVILVIIGRIIGNSYLVSTYEQTLTIF